MLSETSAAELISEFFWYRIQSIYLQYYLFLELQVNVRLRAVGAMVTSWLSGYLQEVVQPSVVLGGLCVLPLVQIFLLTFVYPGDGACNSRF